MNLRPYQNDAIRAVLDGFREWQKQLLVLPTGAGKTIVFSNLAKIMHDAEKRTLILAHREELVDQAIDKLRGATGILAEKEKAEHVASRSASVVVGSIQTLRGDRLARWGKDHFDLIVLDESHHALAESFMSTLNHFDGHAKVLGVTATPNLVAKKNLGQYFENIAYEIGLLDLIKQGYLCPIKIKTLKVDLDLASVKSTTGDYDSRQLGDVLTPYLKAIAGKLVQEVDKKKTLVFLPLVETSKKFRDILLEMGVTAEHVDGDSDDRRVILDRFSRGRFQFLTNAMLLTEGYDEPSIECILNLRPTRSSNLYSQIIGRGTRLHEGKDSLLVLDPLWLHERHNLIRPAHLVAGSDKEAKEMTEHISALDDQIDLFDIQASVAKQREEKLAEELKSQAKRKSKFISLEELAVSFHCSELVEFESSMRWHDAPMTESQRTTLEKFKFDTACIRNKGHASVVLDKLFSRAKRRLCTLSQARWVRRFGYDPTNMSMGEAAKILDRKFGKKESV